MQLKPKNKTHTHGVWRTDVPPYDKHFQMPGYNFNPHAKSIIIGRLIICHYHPES